MRAGYSAAASLLDLMDVALQKLSHWDVLLFLSGGHFPLRPREEFAKYLWYHPVNFVSSEEGEQQFEKTELTSYHYELCFECTQHLWDLTKDMQDRRVIMNQKLGHPNMTAAIGHPFVIL